MLDLKANPFFLDDKKEKWVYDTLAGMSTEEKIGQMFCPVGGNTEEGFLKEFLEEYKPGAIMYRPMPHSKPNPEVFVKAGEFLGIGAEECVVVEDAYAGIDAARAAGMKSVGIGDASGYGKADYKIQAFKELLDIAEV